MPRTPSEPGATTMSTASPAYTSRSAVTICTRRGIPLSIAAGGNHVSPTLVERMVMRLHYAWIVAGITFLALLASAGIGATRAVLVLPLEHDFGWDRATISLALSINLLLFGLCGPFAGALMARFGVRRVMLAALTTLAIAVGASTLMTQAWQLVALWGVLVGLGSGAMALV